MRIRVRFLDWLLAVLVIGMGRLLFRTLRIHYLVAGENTNPYCRNTTAGFIYSVWHDAMVFPIFAGRHVRTVALVSRHQDGSHLARGLKMQGIGLVRGSTNHNGASAMRELLRLPVDTHVVLTPDGPRGPPRRIKQGLVFLASHSGRSIVPTAFAAVRSWKVSGRWTNLTIPKPFTTVYALSGPAIHVAANCSVEEMNLVYHHVQAEMDRLTQEAERLATARPRAERRAA